MSTTSSTPGWRPPAAIASMGLAIDALTGEQRAYLASWEAGT